MHRDSDGAIFFSIRNLCSTAELPDEASDGEDDGDENDDVNEDDFKEKEFGEPTVDQPTHFEYDTTMTGASENPNVFEKRGLNVNIYEPAEYDTAAQHNKEANEGESSHSVSHGRTG